MIAVVCKLFDDNFVAGSSFLLKNKFGWLSYFNFEVVSSGNSIFVFSLLQAGLAVKSRRMCS
jgi:hypothetical protein